MSLAQLEKFRATDLVNLETGEAASLVLQRAAELGASDLFILSDERDRAGANDESNCRSILKHFAPAVPRRPARCNDAWTNDERRAA